MNIDRDLGTNIMGHVTAAYSLVMTAKRFPNTKCMYIAPSRALASHQMWHKIAMQCSDYMINATFDKDNLHIRLGNGSQISLVGANSDKEFGALRGLMLDLVICDKLKEFDIPMIGIIKHIILPTILDKNGSFSCVSDDQPRIHRSI